MQRGHHHCVPVHLRLNAQPGLLSLAILMLTFIVLFTVVYFTSCHYIILSWLCGSTLISRRQLSEVKVQFGGHPIA